MMLESCYPKVTKKRLMSCIFGLREYGVTTPISMFLRKAGVGKKTLSRGWTVSTVIVSLLIIQGILFGRLPKLDGEYSLDGGFRVISTGDNYTELEFILPDYGVIKEEVDSVMYHRLIHPQAGYLMKEGLPELLTFSTGLSIPEQGIAKLTEIYVEQEERLNGIRIFPSQGFNLEICGERGFIIDEDFYGGGRKVKRGEQYGGRLNYPEEIAVVSSPARMRDIRLVSLSVNPFIYHPDREELTVISRIRVRVEYVEDKEQRDEDKGLQLLAGLRSRRERRGRSRSFEAVYRNIAVNYGQFRTRNEYQARSILVVHHHTEDAQYRALIGQLMNWKRDKGFETAAVSTEDLRTPQAIKGYIQNAYDTWEHPPEYIIIIGGKTGPFAVPVWTIYDSDAYIPGNSDGDHSYTTLDGDDILPDAFIGRISISTVEQLATAWAKIRNYERTPYFEENNNWHNHNLLVGDPGVSGISTIITNKYIKELMLSYNSNRTFAEVYSAPFATQMQNGINQGVAFFSFRGLENFAGWPAPSDGELYNGLKMPHNTIITCRTVDFSGGKQVCRLFRMGTPANPKGIITGIGMSWVTETAFNNCLTGGIYHGIFAGGQRTMGEAIVNGKLNQWITFKNSHAWQLPRYFHQTALIGDPSLDIWTGTPKVLNADYPETLPPGSNSITIIVTDENELPINDAWVTIRQGDDVIFETGYTDGNGAITHFFDRQHTGEVRVTVTKPDYIAHLGRFTIEGDAAVSFESLIVNGQVNAGSRAEFDIRVRNFSGNVVNGLTGTISTVSERIEIISGESGFGNIQADGTGNSINSFVVDVCPETEAGYVALFVLTLTDNAQNSWISRFRLPVNNGYLVPVDLVIEDNDDGVLDPDERATLKIYLRNEGDLNLSGIAGTLSGGGHGLNYISNRATFGDIAVNSTVTSSEQHFVVEAGDFVVPGTVYQLILVLENEDGFRQEQRIELPIGSPTIDDPLGPDAYGYWAYDCGDTGYEEAPVYDWIEISPRLGGSGVNTTLTSDFNNNQNRVVMDLPFPFRFYGIRYESISICANGWISFGHTEQATQRNWRLPGPLGPSPIVAAFWDNLSLGAGAVYTRYDEINSQFIIQWQNARNVIQNAEETFQIILYNQAFYHTATGDGPIKIQYKVFNNLNNGANTPTGIGNWGNYATVGIADHTSTAGLEYTFNNTYPVPARPITDESAIYFTTGSISHAPYVTIDSLYYSDDNNNLPEYGETGNLSITLRNIGGQDAEGITAILSSSDRYVEIIENSAGFGDIPSGETASVNDAYSIAIAPDTPDRHRIFFNLNVIEANIDWDFRFHIEVHAPYIAIDSLSVNRPPVYGEEVNINICLINDGRAASGDISAVLTTDDEYVTVINNEAQFGWFDTEETVNVPNAYTIRVGNNVPNRHKARFNLSIAGEEGQKWNDEFYLTLLAPEIKSSTPAIYDPMPGGNNNGVIDPGETVTVFLPIINEGDAISPRLEIEVDSADDLVIVNDVSPASFNYIVPGDAMYPAVNITLYENVVHGTPLRLNYTCRAGEYLFSGSFLLGVGGTIPVQIGTGTAQTAPRAACPINIYYKSLRSQTVYTAQELYDNGICAGGQISSMAYYVISSPEYPLRNFIVRMRHTTAVDASEHIEGPYTTVYENPVYTPSAGGWHTMLFTTPFEWNGTDNILVDTAFSSTEGWSNSGQIRIYNVPDGFRYIRADNFDQTDAETTTTSSEKPQILILFGIDVNALTKRPVNLVGEFDNDVINLTWEPPTEQRAEGFNSSLRLGVEGRAESVGGTNRNSDTHYRNYKYNVYRNGIRINSTPVEETYFIDEDFNPRMENYYYITSLYQSSESPPSNIVLMKHNIVAQPHIIPPEPIQYDKFMVTITTETENADIYYTLDGSSPDETGYLFENPFEITYHTTVKATAFKEDYLSSDVASIDYILLYAPQNIRSSGSLSTAYLYWDEPWSPEKNLHCRMKGMDCTDRAESRERRAESVEIRTKGFNSSLRLGVEGRAESVGTGYPGEVNKKRLHGVNHTVHTELFGYNVYRSYQEEEFSLITSTPINETEFEDTGLEEGAYRYYVKAVYDKGLSQPTRTVNVNVGTTSADDDAPELYITSLFNAYPNPFNPETVIRFSLCSEQKVTIDIFDIKGRKINTIVNEILPAGRHQVIWQAVDGNGQIVSSGVYLYRMNTEAHQETKKMILLK